MPRCVSIRVGSITPFFHIHNYNYNYFSRFSNYITLQLLCFWDFEITITITITPETVINYKLQLQLLIVDESFSPRALNNILEEIINPF